MKCEYEQKLDNKVLLIKISGDFDVYSHKQIKDDLNTAIEREGSRYIILDFKNLNYIDSSGLGSLISLIKNTSSLSKKLCIISPKANILKIFALTKLDQVLIIFKDYEEALKSYELN